jgi:ATP-dependent DNA helicase DinG
MALVQQVAEVFAPHGLLHSSGIGFEPRAGQTQMALAVAEQIESGGALVVEAGTGVGKTFAYLVPALLSGVKVLLSTATKTLQNQLFDRDLPGLIRLLGHPLRMALLKGRSSYVCVYRLERAIQGFSGLDRLQSDALATIARWVPSSLTGDLAELPGLDEQSSLIPWITSTRDNCLGSSCPQASQCHVNQARREAMSADVVVVNHHLFFADLSVRESGMAELLPTARVMIFDEAHQLNDIGIQFLGAQLSHSQVRILAQDVLACGQEHARGVVNWPDLCARPEQALKVLASLFGQGLLSSGGPSSGRYHWSGAAPEGLDAQVWAHTLSMLVDVLQALDLAITGCMEASPEFMRLHERLGHTLDILHLFSKPASPENVRWVEAGSYFRLVESPLDVASVFRDKLLRNPESLRSLIFTSATLGNDEQLSWFTQPCGLDHARVLRVPSPFDYQRQAVLYIPSDLPPPTDPQHASQVALKALDWARLLRGRTLVLSTTLRSVRVIAQVLRQHLSPDQELQVLFQGHGSRNKLLERFREDQAGRGSILVASASFWEGVDIPGDALQLVVIDKLPFPPPYDPLVRARTRRLESQHRNAFQDYFLPEAVVSLKQGAGRLIRSLSDRGALVICDVRLLNMSYARRILSSLEPMRRVTQASELSKWLAQLGTDQHR